MQALIQRVKSASVEIDGQIYSSIGPGLLTLLGVEKDDSKEALEKLIKKLTALRIFSDQEGKMNRSLLDCGGEHLIVSQFTLLADCTKGARPSFVRAEEPKRAKEIFEAALKLSSELGVKTQGGVFAADMKVSLVNDGPVTIHLETK